MQSASLASAPAAAAASATTTCVQLLQRRVLCLPSPLVLLLRRRRRLQQHLLVLLVSLLLPAFCDSSSDTEHQHQQQPVQTVVDRRGTGGSASRLATRAASTAPTVRYVALDGDQWTVTNANRSISIPARVPGGIYTDLQRAGIISEPNYATNDVLQRWVSYDNWTWTTNFTVDPSILASANVQLVFHGVDTVSTISLNGQRILNTNNMFSRYTVDVGGGGGLRPGRNELTVAIGSPVYYALSKFSEFYTKNYTVYPTSHPRVQNGEEHANFIRKMQSSFSWDWGPAFPSMGIWKSVHIEYYKDVLLRDVVIGVQEEGELWNLTLVLYLEGKSLPSKIDVAVDLETVGDLFVGSAPVEDGRVTLTNLNVSEKRVARWWPNGFGDQVLYRLRVSAMASTKVVRIGFRTIELVQNTIPGVVGLTFFFKVNGWPIYAKGSNLIPIDVLPERVTEDTIRSLLLSAKDANMNMLRVWGGGIYELDQVYDLADELGILLWQDLMFACALYPTNPAFLDNISEEVRQNVRRLQHHPSIALWAGNNENELAIASMWWPPIIFAYRRYQDDYRTLYVHTIKPIVQEIDPWREYLVSSPTNGLESERNDYLSSDPSSSLYGDVHFYSYMIESWVPSNYPTARFVSEFGFQSFPSFHSWQQITNRSSDLVYPLSDLANHRQHHVVALLFSGNANIERKVFGKFNGPNRTLDASEQFRVFCYLTQILQAVSVKTAVEKFRRDRSQLNTLTGEGHNMGALYWQLNDVWQAPTWSSIEYDGTWKMLHNYAKNFFEPLLITAHHEYAVWQQKNDICVWMISDLEKPMTVNATVALYNFTSFSPVRSISMQTELCADCSMEAQRFKFTELFKEPCSRTTCFLIVSMRDQRGDLLSDNWFLPNAPKKMETMVDANIRATVIGKPTMSADGRHEFEIEVKADAPAPFTWLEANGVGGHFSDNGFFLYEPSKSLSFITSNLNVTAKLLADKLSVIQFARSINPPSSTATPEGGFEI